ncbi:MULTISPECIES: alpha/beta hydrolase [unclassified Lactobacillus]|uniref:alpha/beta hydrolase n=1 Tax=unclassified Lactobacillus TaxID=2620435 RepID=UPI00223F7DD2|nr:MULTISPECIES: alpha/beta hydrolase [unclassified Lactobacillus]
MKKISLILVLFLVLGLAACSKAKPQAAKNPETQVAKVHFSKKYQVKSTPTLIFHGAMSNYHAEESLVKKAQRLGFTNNVIRANVDPDGKVTFVGTLKQNAINPIVEVNYENNIQFNLPKAGMYAVNVVKALKQQYSIKKVNMVAHSLGNMSVMYYLLASQREKLPTLNKQVAIAGLFDGVNLPGATEDMAEPKNLRLNEAGKPNKMNSTYKQLLQLRKLYSQTQLPVLNIVGNKADNSDGLVSNVSSESLKYLVGSDPNYQLQKYYGPNADHGRLTYNSQVTTRITNFLWD